MLRKEVSLVDTSFFPILVVPAVPHERGIRFLHRDTQIDIGPEMTDTLWKVLSYANGYNDISSIAELAKLQEDDVSEIFSELFDMELVVDSREQFMHFHRVSNYPTAFNSSLTQDEIEAYTKSKRLPVKTGEIFRFEPNHLSAFYSIREKRRSCRSFSTQELSKGEIGSICHFAYSISDHSVPSGGALYPLRIYVLIEKKQYDLLPGYYEYDAESDTLIRFSDEVDEEQLKYCFNQEEMPFNSSVQIIIAADLKRQPHKYANRGYRLTLIEAGHVAENISLYCAEQGLGACEMGGVQDKPLRAELGLDENVWPILAIPVGYPANSKKDELNKIRYVEENVGEDHVVKDVWAKEFGDDGSFFGAMSTYEDEYGNVQSAGATSPSYADAVFKATIEGYERWRSSQVRIDFRGTARELDLPWLNPQLFFPLTTEQAKKNGTVPFSEDLPICWTKGVSSDGSEVYIPSDIVYYGQKTDENRIYFGHSSGIAAYSNFEEAKKRAVVELIERDALMRSWYTRTSPYVLSDGLLTVHARKRVAHWTKQNRKLLILQMPSDYGWVFEAVFIGEEFPFFISGAAATINRVSIDDAINKALQEAEYNLLLTLKDPDMSEIDPRDVASPFDHGKVYFSQVNAEKISWLWSGETTEAFVEPKFIGYKQLLAVLDVSVIDMSEDGSELKVVRAFSPKLVPINFGFDSAHYTHPALEGKVHPDSLKMPHYFA